LTGSPLPFFVIVPINETLFFFSSHKWILLILGTPQSVGGKALFPRPFCGTDSLPHSAMKGGPSLPRDRNSFFSFFLSLFFLPRHGKRRLFVNLQILSAYSHVTKPFFLAFCQIALMFLLFLREDSSSCTTGLGEDGGS